MHIEQIVLEGFKSYATRTVISNWDPGFNAITGLNGSGKSNILDAICFLLGIDNLRHVRATSLQDLIYKRGQSGITKASVSIVFDNSIKSQSPIGFNDSPKITVTRQIMVGGKNKYLINGHNSTQKLVENLFQSVQLNVNNPHFLIMQGQITKVLNMKPPEILAMIEETAGTRMFEDRRSKALATLEKKERKVEEIISLLTDIIEPKLQTLRLEQSNFMEFKRAEADIDQLKKILIAYDYFTQTKELEKINQNEEVFCKKLKEFKKEEESLKEALGPIESEILEVIERKESDTKSALRIKTFEQAYKESLKNSTKAATQLELKRTQLESELNNTSKLEQNLKKDEKILAQGLTKAQKFKDELTLMHKEYMELEKNVRQTEDLIQSLKTGVSLSNDGNGETGYSKLIKDLKEELSSVVLELEKSKLKLDSIQEELSILGPQYEKTSQKSSNSMQKLEASKVALKALESKIEILQESFNQSEKEYELLKLNKNDLERQEREYRDLMNHHKNYISHVQFKFSDPEINFDKSLVKGLVAELIHLPESSIEYSTALEVTAGGKLYNVVVENERVANQLLEKGKLTRRVTIIPLNKIVTRQIPTEKIRAASELAGSKVRPAISLIGYDDQVSAAIKFVFGGTFICDDKDTATAVTFDKRILTRSVTIDGDVYEPSGTLTGGSRPSSNNETSLLESLNKYHQAKGKHEATVSELESVKLKLSKLSTVKEEILNLREEKNLKEHEYDMLKREFDQNSYGKLFNQLNSLQSEEIEVNKRIKDLCIEKGQLELQIQHNEREMREFTDNRNDKLSKLEQKLMAAKESFSRESQQLRGAEQKYEHIVAENSIKYFCYTFSSLLPIGQMELSLDKVRDKLEDGKALNKTLVDELELLEVEYQSSTEISKNLEGQIEIEKQYLLKFDQEIEELEHKKTFLNDQLEQIALNRQKLAHDLEKQKEEKSKIEKRSSNLLKQNMWIRDACKNFGVPDGPFDFEREDMRLIRGKLELLERRQNELRKSVNTNVMEMIDRVESKEESLKQMLATVRKDRGKIESTIVKLDDYKKEALERTWRKVNKDFGGIFSDLLGNCDCKLEPPEGQDINAGLEIKVQLGSVWKQSLSELSGGQRSVIALSLILSLLQFKPAPMYILDEIDAALDLSHTQNIGQLFKSRFKGSQFIVVSLKEGMFSNANVLFRTKFRDGISSVEQIGGKSSKA